MSLRAIFLLLSLLVLRPLLATPRALQPVDSAVSGVQVRRPAPARLQALRQQRELQYEEEAPVVDTSQSLWRRFLRWISNWYQTPAYKNGWRYIIYGGFLAAFVFIVLRLLQVDLTGAFGRAPRRAILTYMAEADDIYAPDFMARLVAAEEAGNYRLAVRLGFLSVLKQLTDLGLLDWRPEKTNADYIAEMPPNALRPAFITVARQFEYAWYGEWELSPAQYAEVRAAQVGLITKVPQTVVR
ncbi:DUF4129 domain-containing protein [Hymenobacter sp. HDW8]|uniref:DUF4129 domain-containing protein n=1 Tax=Hymenobacter sp. HDW8 TaxID=2714932 RepID=UPI00140996CF|nr:DUF4129 domain-containing protein [Hymenobacter sp. HDW8]QIL75623.1 DUF4129 domain-containing protein [Hymenobacter sp. HDW8]